MLGEPGGEGEGGAAIKALQKRKIFLRGPEKVEGLSQPSGLRTARAFPAAGARLRRGPGRPEPAAQHPPAPLRCVYLGHGCLPRGPALGHRLMPQSVGHGSPMAIAASRRPPPQGPGLSEREALGRLPGSPSDTYRTAHAGAARARAPCWIGGVRAPLFSEAGGVKLKLHSETRS